MKVSLKRYSSESGSYEVYDELDTHTIGKSLTPEALAAVLDTYANNMAVGYQDGVLAGYELARAHRTIQRSVIVLLMGIIKGMSEQAWTDARNEQAIALAKKVAALYEQEGAGPYV